MAQDNKNKINVLDELRDAIKGYVNAKVADAANTDSSDSQAGFASFHAERRLDEAFEMFGRCVDEEFNPIRTLKR